MATLHTDPNTPPLEPSTSERTYNRDDDRYDEDLYQDDTIRYEQDRTNAITGNSSSGNWGL